MANSSESIPVGSGEKRTPCETVLEPKRGGGGTSVTPPIFLPASTPPHAPTALSAPPPMSTSPAALSAPRAPAAAAAAFAPTVGAAVRARYLATTVGKFGTKWYSGTVQAVHPDGASDIMYDDGDVEKNVKPCFIKPPLRGAAPRLQPPAAADGRDASKRASPSEQHASSTAASAAAPAAAGSSAAASAESHLIVSGKRKVRATTVMIRRAGRQAPESL